MMKKKIDSPLRKLKMLVVLPLVAMLFYAFAVPDYQYGNENNSVAPQGKTIDVKGQVVKADGTTPLQGTSVILRNSTTGTITDKDGNFVLKGIPADGELIFTFVGFKSKVQKVYGDPMKIQMEISKVGLDEIVVVGYGTPPPPPPPAAWIKPSINNVKKGIDDANPPLIFLDGVPITKAAMDKLNPETIQSISVLKDQSATIIYGEKGKNGVILIKTKGNKEPLEFKAEKIVIQDGQVVFTVVEEMPEFPGKETAVRKFIAENIKYPTEAKEKGIQGKVYVTFVVKLDGTVGDAKIARGVHPLLDNEAIRVVNLLPTWKPGKQGGKEVNVAYTIPVQFALDAGKTKETVSFVPPKVNEKGEKEVFVVVEEMPEFPGGALELRRFLARSVKYPVEAQKAKTQGKVYVSFVVNAEGKVEQAKVEQSVDSALDAEAIRVVGLMPDWKPGKQRGVAVSVAYTVPIQFMLQ